MLKASVIIIVEPNESNLMDCLNSACSQMMTEYEVICVLGRGSSAAEDALGICSAGSSMLHVVRLPETADVWQACQAGMDAAQGQYISFLSSENTYASQNTLQQMVEAAEKTGAAIVGGGLQAGGERPEQLKDLVRQYSFADTRRMDYSELQQDKFCQRFLFRKSMLTERGLCFRQDALLDVSFFLFRALMAEKRITAPARKMHGRKQNREM